MLPRPLQQFIEAFSALPSLGPRQATRLAFFILRRGSAFIATLSRAVAALGTLATCSQCFQPYEPANELRNANSGLRNTNGYESTKNGSGLCHICANPQRNQAVIAIVERETDLLSLEKSKRFTGRYLILGEIGRAGTLEPEQKLRLNHLKATVAKTGQAEGIIIALNPTTLGDIGTSLLIQELKPIAKKVTRLGRGLPTGGEIEFADEDTLAGALENRR